MDNLKTLLAAGPVGSTPGSYRSPSRVASQLPFVSPWFPTLLGSSCGTGTLKPFANQRLSLQQVTPRWASAQSGLAD